MYTMRLQTCNFESTHKLSYNLYYILAVSYCFIFCSCSNFVNLDSPKNKKLINYNFRGYSHN